MPFLKRVNCPSCGAPIEIKFPGISQATCEYCATICTFNKDEIINSGKKSQLIPPLSGLTLNQEIKVHGKKYTVIGRITYGYSRKEGDIGGTWDEWFLQSGDGELWLTEDSGIFYLESKIDTQQTIKQGLNPGEVITLGKSRYLITGVGTVFCRGISGMVPFPILPEESYEYADALRCFGNGPDSLSIEFDDTTPTLFMGEILNQEDLKYENNSETVEIKNAEALRCNSCGSPLTAEGDRRKILSILCNSCNTLNEIGRETAISLGKVSGGLEYMLKLPLYSSLLYENIEYKITGRMIQKWEDEDESGYVKEYLLYNPDIGYLYLEEEEDIYFVWTKCLPSEKPLNEIFREGDSFHHSILEKDYEFEEKGNLELVYVDGALPFLAVIGDAVLFTDSKIKGGSIEKYSEEIIFNSSGEPVELEQYTGQWVSNEEIYKSFPDIIPPPPAPYKKIFGEVFISILGSIIGIFLIFFSFALDNQVEIHKSDYSQMDLKGNEITTEEFSIEKADETIEVKVSTDVDQTWTHVGVALLKSDAEEVIAADDLGIEYYHGTEDGESWSEGSRSESIYWKIPEAGRYRLMLTVFDGDTSPQTAIRVVIEKNAVRTYPLIIVGIFWFILPLSYFIRKK